MGSSSVASLLCGYTSAVIPPLGLSLEYVSDTSGNSATMNLGATVPAGNTRYVIVATHGCVNATAGNVSSVSIGGNAATLLYRPFVGMGRPTEIWYIVNNTLTSGTVTVNYDTAQFASGMAVWNLINPGSITPTFSNFNNTAATAALSLSVTVPTGGVAMLLDSTNVSSGDGTWTNATELYDNPNGSVYRSGAIRTTAGTATVTITRPNTQNHTFVAAAWGP